jgi:hypothetical protein
MDVRVSRCTVVGQDACLLRYRSHDTEGRVVRDQQAWVHVAGTGTCRRSGNRLVAVLLHCTRRDPREPCACVGRSIAPAPAPVWFERLARGRWHAVAHADFEHFAGCAPPGFPYEASTRAAVQRGAQPPSPENPSRRYHHPDWTLQGCWTRAPDRTNAWPSEHPAN